MRALAETQPNDIETWIALGDAYRDDDRNEDAIAAYTKAEKANAAPTRRDWPLFYARAMAEDKTQPEKSEADLLAALKLSPDQPELLNYLGYSAGGPEPAHSRGSGSAGKGTHLEAL